MIKLWIDIRDLDSNVPTRFWGATKIERPMSKYGFTMWVIDLSDERLKVELKDRMKQIKEAMRYDERVLAKQNAVMHYKKSQRMYWKCTPNDASYNKQCAAKAMYDTLHI